MELHQWLANEYGCLASQEYIKPYPYWRLYYSEDERVKVSFAATYKSYMAFVNDIYEDRMQYIDLRDPHLYQLRQYLLANFRGIEYEEDLSITKFEIDIAKILFHNMPELLTDVTDEGFIKDVHGKDAVQKYLLQLHSCHLQQN